MRKVLGFTVCLLVTVPAAAQEEGKAVFDKHCGHCHAPGGDRPGTLQLGLTRGEANAVLEERSNLPAPYIKTIVRHGLNGMPAFKPTIVTEAELDALAGYLSAQ